MKKKIIIPIVIVIAAIVVLANSFYTTKEDQYSVVKQFGKIVAANDSSGLRPKIPFVQEVSHVSKAKRIYDLPESEVITSDKKTMIVDAYVLWQVTDVLLYTQTLNASSSTAQGRIDAIVYNAIKTTISAMTQEELIASRDSALAIQVSGAEEQNIVVNDLGESDEEQLSEEEKTDVIVISDKLLEAIGSQCDQYGISITDVKIKVLDLPNENKEAVYIRMITERNNIAAAYKAQGESEAQKIRNTTDKEVEVMKSEARAKADAIVAEGEAEYMRILSEAYNDPDKADFYIFSLQLDSLKKSVTNGNTTIFLDKNNPIASIFKKFGREFSAIQLPR